MTPEATAALGTTCQWKDDDDDFVFKGTPAARLYHAHVNEQVDIRYMSNIWFFQHWK